MAILRLKSKCGLLELFFGVFAKQTMKYAKGSELSARP
jgi:hypothetical protein